MGHFISLKTINSDLQQEGESHRNTHAIMAIPGAVWKASVFFCVSAAAQVGFDPGALQRRFLCSGRKFTEAFERKERSTDVRIQNSRLVERRICLGCSRVVPILSLVALESNRSRIEYVWLLYLW